MPNLTNWQKLVTDYEAFVEETMNGYDDCIYEYTNDLACRNKLEESKDISEVKELWLRVKQADIKLRDSLIPLNKCIYGDYPKTWFWYWGYPKNSPELENDIRNI
ncbi:MAG: hypothetical protein COA78_01100 [Blastopirellula sp.]|nr:MAG: hypothetical protein COA78_01100 [Blastopirellula sp.]